MTQREFDARCAEWNAFYQKHLEMYREMYKNDDVKIARALAPLRAAIAQMKAKWLREDVEPSPNRHRDEAYSIHRYVKNALSEFVPKHKEHWDTEGADVSFRVEGDMLTVVIEMKKK